MRLDPPGLTGPSTLRDHPLNSDVDHGHAFSDSSTRDLLLPPQISFLRRGRSVDVFVIDGASYPRRSTILEYRQRLVDRGSVRASSYERHDFASETTTTTTTTTVVVDHHREDELEIGNATAFRVSYRSVATISGRKGRDFCFCRGCNGDRCAAQGSGHDRVDEVHPVERKDREDHDDGGSSDDCGNGVDNGVVFAAELDLSVLQTFKSRSFHHAGCSKPRTRWKKRKKKVRQDRKTPQESIDFAQIPNANATDVPPFAAFAYTAYNDENEIAGGASRAIGHAGEGEEERCFEETDELGNRDFGRRVRDEDELVRGNDGDSVRGGGSGKCRDPWQTGTRETLPAKGERNEKRESHYTARFQEPITNESRVHETKLSTHGPTKASNSCGRKYGLLFILYLLAWPLVCSTNPSGQFPSSFTHDPSLSPADHPSQRNATHVSSLLSSSTAHRRQQQQQQQQHKEQQQHYRQLEEKHRTRDRPVRDAEYSWDGKGHHRRRHEEQQGEQGREQREVEESSYRDRQPVLESDAIHPYNEYSWEVNQINPWLSACDLAGPAPADLQGSCGPPEVPKTCPTPCAVNPNGKGNDVEFHELIERLERTDADERNAAGGGRREKSEGVRMAPEQCLFYLEESHKRDICRDDFGRTSTRSFLTPRENRYWFMSGLRLRHCCEHAVVNALAPGKGGPLENVLNGGQKCADALDKLLLVDALAARLHCEFEEVLARYDCAQPYSVIFNCTHCKEAYRKWVCSSLVPYFAHGGPQDLDTLDSWTGSRLRPCRSFCQSVEQRCPYLLPGDRAPAYPTQYAGEPTFLCRDPNIPETGEQAARALHSSETDECCFHACSEEAPGSGICANCTDQEPRTRKRVQDPPTAPHCEINPIQPASTGGEYRDPDSESTDSSAEEGDRYDSSTDSAVLSMMNVMQQQGTSLCGSGGVGSMTSVSSSDRSTASILPQLFWLCSILSSTLGNVRTVPVLWISKIFLWSMVPLSGGGGGSGGGGDDGGAGAGAGAGDAGGCDGSDGVCGCDDDSAAGSSPVEMIRLIRLVAWLCRSVLRRASHVDVHTRAKWLLDKWMAVERRYRSWWCCCWYWWWWRWQPVLQRQRGDTRSWRLVATCPTIARRSPVVHDPPGTFHESFYHARSTSRPSRWSGRYSLAGHGSSSKCPWHRLSWWWWWLYRWWRSRRRHRGSSRRDGDRPREFPRGRSGTVRRKRVNRKRRKRRDKDTNDTLEPDVHRSPIRRRYSKVSSRDDPP